MRSSGSWPTTWPTIYRYFKSKRDLVEAVGRLYAERLGTIGTMAPASLDELLEQTRAIFRRWETLEPELRAAAGSALGRELQARHLPARLAAMRRVLEPHARDLSEADRERLARVALIFFSSGMADLMRRYLGATVDEAAELVVWAVQRLIGDGKDGGR